MFPRYPLAVVSALAVLACSDGSGPSSVLTIAQLAGTWDLTHLEMVRAADNSVIQDTKALYGVDASLTIRRGGTVSLDVRISGQPGMIVNGTIAIHGDTIVYNPENGSPYEATFRLEGRTMTWLSLDIYPWDPDGTGTSEDVRERDTWQRR